MILSARNVRNGLRWGLSVPEENWVQAQASLDSSVPGSALRA